MKAEAKSIAVVPILFSSEKNYEPRKGGEFFAYLTFKLMMIEQRDGDGRRFIRVEASSV